VDNDADTGVGSKKVDEQQDDKQSRKVYTVASKKMQWNGRRDCIVLQVPILFPDVKKRLVQTSEKDVAGRGEPVCRN
jgi:hypothetical protein